MQEAPESGSSASAGSSFSSHPAASIKEEDCSPEKERPPEAEYISSRCVLFTYFQGDISAVVDEHFSRALSQPSSFSLGSAKAARNAGSWRGERGAAGAPSGPAPRPRLGRTSRLSPPSRQRLVPGGHPLGSQARRCQLLGPFRVKKESIKPFRLCRVATAQGKAAWEAVRGNKLSFHCRCFTWRGLLPNSPRSDPLTVTVTNALPVDPSFQFRVVIVMGAKQKANVGTILSASHPYKKDCVCPYILPCMYHHPDCCWSTDKDSLSF